MPVPKLEPQSPHNPPHSLVYPAAAIVPPGKSIEGPNGISNSHFNIQGTNLGRVRPVIEN